MTNIKIADITLRECEQEHASKLSFKDKQEVAKLLEKLNVDIIETGYINPAAAGDAVFVRMLAGELEQSVLSVPVGATRESIDAAWAALSKAKKPRLNLIVPTSTVGMEYGYNMKPDAMLALIEELIAYAKTLCDDIEFTADDAIRSDSDFLAQVLKAAITAGVSTITLCDSVGELLPSELSEFVASALRAVPELRDVTLGFHVKDKLGLAYAAALRAIGSAVNLVKVSSVYESDTLLLEGFLNILKIRGESIGISSNLSTTSYQRICSRIAMITGVAGSAGRGTAGGGFGVGSGGGDGGGAVAGETGGTAGGGKSEAALPENADIIQLRSYIQSIGYDISEEELEQIFSQYKDIARSKSVVADDIEALVAETAGQAPPTYQLKNYVINSGSAIAATAYLEFEKKGEVYVALSAGDGPIDAAFKAAESIFGTSYELEDFRIHAVTSGREATGDALVKLRCDGKLYSGRGVSTDIVGASIRAYLSAVNKILHEA